MKTRREDGRVRRALLRQLRRALVAALATGILAVVFAIVSHREVALVVLALGVVVSGSRYLGRAIVHRRDPDHRSHRDIRAQALSDLRLACAWILIGLVLALLAVLIDVPFVVPVLALLLVAGLHQRGWVAGHTMVESERRHEIGSGTDHVASRPWVRLWEERSRTSPDVVGSTAVPRMVRRRVPNGQISFYLNRTLFLLVVIWVGYAGLAFAEVVHVAAPDLPPLPLFSHPPGSGSEAASVPSETADPPPPPSYADLCPDLPDPSAIGHGLGERFEHDGAVAAGCGGPARLVGDSTFVSEGICEGRMRSLAVSDEVHPAVLLYGAPARFALEASASGTLTFAEVVKPAGGEVDVIATTGGNFAFARSVPSLSPGDADARRCGQVDELARPFAALPPPLVELWRDRVLDEEGWIWPEPGDVAGIFTFAAYPSGARVATATCSGDFVCSMGPAGHERSIEGTAYVSLDEFGSFVPAAGSGSGG